MILPPLIFLECLLTLTKRIILSAEKVRNRTDACQGYIEVETPILWYWKPRVEHWKIECLIVNSKTATLRVIEKDDALLEHVTLADIVIEAIGTTEYPIEYMCFG